MATYAAVWHGTEQESLALVKAIGCQCMCNCGPVEERRAICEGHRMLVEDQRALDGLLFAHRLKDRLQREEWSVAAAASELGRTE